MIRNAARSLLSQSGLLALAVALAACGGGNEDAGTVAPAGVALAQSSAGAAECSDAMAVEAWQGTISYSHARDVEAANPDHVVYSVDVDVTARLEESYRNENAVGFVASVMGGTIAHSSEEHSHYTDEHRVDLVLAGEGPPAQGSRMSLSVRSDCRYDIYFLGTVHVSGTSSGEPAEGSKSINPLAGNFEVSGLELSGTFDFPVYHPGEIEASVDKPVWFAERYDVADALGNDLGAVQVTWSFVPAD